MPDVSSDPITLYGTDMALDTVASSVAALFCSSLRLLWCGVVVVAAKDTRVHSVCVR